MITNRKYIIQYTGEQSEMPAIDDDLLDPFKRFEIISANMTIQIGSNLLNCQCDLSYSSIAPSQKDSI